TAQAATAFPDLSLFWATTNTPSATAFCSTNGNIGTTEYATGGPDCGNNATQIATGIYILGDFVNGKDTDEFDEHVLAHEFGHYFEDNFGRSDSTGGSHGSTDRLDLRVAFSEGWGDGFSGMATSDPVYRDSFNGAAQDFGFNLESTTVATPGYYSE